MPHPSLTPVTVQNGAARLLRGWSAAVIATVLAAGSHTLAGPGHHDDGPSPLVWILTLALAGPVCTALAGRLLSWTRLSVGVLLSQAVFHALYSLGPAAPPSAALPSASFGHLHTHGSLAAPAPLPGVSDPAVAEPLLPAAEHTMLAAHLLAAVATVVLLRHGERSVLATADWVLLRRPVLILRPAQLTPACGPRLVGLPTPPVLPALRELVSSLRWRGPPSVACPL